MALGASPARVAWDVAREVVVQVVAGLAIGLPAALAAAHMAKALLFGVTPADSGNYLLGAALLAIVASFAVWLPARRACSIAPCEALRRE